MFLVSALLASLVATSQDGPAATWRAIPMPALCRSASEPLIAPRLARGTHLILSRDDVEPGISPLLGPALNPAAFASMLSEEARRASWNVSFNPNFPPLLVRGPQAGCQTAESFCAELDLAVRALDVEISVWLVRGAGSSAAEAALPKDAPWAATRLRSGSEAMLGERSAQSYVHNYSVEVATDSGVAAPIVGRAFTGDVLHLRAMRVNAGASVYLDGMLDLSRLDSMQDFELSAADLGSVQHPQVSALQIVFSGCVASGSPLRVAWGSSGGSDSAGEGSLWIVVRAAPDTPSGNWRVLDTALVEAPPWNLPLVSPGSGIELAVEANGEPIAPQPISSAVLAKEGEVSRNGNARARAFFVGGNGIVLGPRSEQEGWAAIDTLRAAVEATRAKTVQLTVQNGQGFVRLPVASGSRWRVLRGVETTAVVDYDVEIAPETWMPGPRIERVLDGYCVEGLAAADHTSFSAWTASTPERKIAERSSVPLGRLELPRRTWRSSHGELRASATAEQVLLGSNPLSVGLRTP